MRLNVYVEINGRFEQVGQLITKQAVGGVFTYHTSWINNHPNLSLSFSLPLSQNEFKGREIKPYFSGLLPEGQALSEIASNLRISTGSYLKILRALGDECIGATRIIDAEIDETKRTEEEPETKDFPRSNQQNNAATYEELTQLDLEKIANSTYPKSAQLNAEARLSIAGVQAKTGVYIDPETGFYFLPKNAAPSNWIAKPASLRFSNLIENEFYCMSLAKCCGLQVAECKILNTKKPMLLIKRFDRTPYPKRREIAGHIAFSRLHQEDFCQALGIQPSKKYESQHTYYARKSAELMRAACTDVVSNLKEFFKLAVFNYLIGNCDTHLKNYSLLHSANWETINLAPAYDLVSTAAYPELTDNLALHIGTAKHLGSVTASNFVQFGADLGLSKRASLSLLNEFCEQFNEGIKCCACENETAEKIAAESLKRQSSLA